MTVTELRERAAEEAEAARTIKDKAEEESRGLTEEEALAFDKHLKESERIEKEAERQERLEAAEARLNKPQERQVTPETADGSRIEVSKPELFRFGELRAFKGPKAEANAYLSGRWLMATIMKDAPSRQWCRDHSVEMRVQTEGVNTAGGFVVPSVMERAIIDLREEYGSARQNLRVHPMSSDHSYIPRRSGGITAYFIGETDAITASDKSWNQVELTAKKLGALTRMSSELSEDAVINMADDLAVEMAYAFAQKEDECFIDGDGTSTYGGMIGIRVKMIDGSHAGSYVSAITPGDQFSEIDAGDLVSVMAALPKYARANAKWHCSPYAKTQVFDRLALALGGMTAAMIAAGAANKYSGYPIEEWAAMPTSNTAIPSEIMLIFGDMRMAATLGDRRGIVIKTSEDRYLEYDQIAIQATERFCVNSHDIGGAAATSRGPVVGLYGVA
jgi:HK97 family phage major capsid protein